MARNRETENRELAMSFSPHSRFSVSLFPGCLHPKLRARRAELTTEDPKNLEFFDCFESSAQNAVHCAELLLALAKSGEVGNFDRMSAITEDEHTGDRIAHETLDRLEQTYIAPIDRDDIHRLITRIDDVVDMTEAVAQRMMCYEITSISEAFKNQCDVLVKATRLMSAAVLGLRHIIDVIFTITGCILGMGATRGMSSVRWGLGEKIVLACFFHVAEHDHDGGRPVFGTCQIAVAFVMLAASKLPNAAPPVEK